MFYFQLRYRIYYNPFSEFYTHIMRNLNCSYVHKIHGCNIKTIVLVVSFDILYFLVKIRCFEIILIECTRQTLHR